MRLPIKVCERLTKLEIVDADDVVIASQPVKDWHGAPLNERPETVRANFAEIVAAVNRATGSTPSR